MKKNFYLSLFVCILFFSSCSLFNNKNDEIKLEEYHPAFLDSLHDAESKLGSIKRVWGYDAVKSREVMNINKTYSCEGEEFTIAYMPEGLLATSQLVEYDTLSTEIKEFIENNPDAAVDCSFQCPHNGLYKTDSNLLIDDNIFTEFIQYSIEDTGKILCYMVRITTGKKLKENLLSTGNSGLICKGYNFDKNMKGLSIEESQDLSIKEADK